MKISTPYQMVITLDDHALLVSLYTEFEGVIQIKKDLETKGENQTGKHWNS